MTTWILFGNYMHILVHPWRSDIFIYLNFSRPFPLDVSGILQFSLFKSYAFLLTFIRYVFFFTVLSFTHWSYSFLYLFVNQSVYWTHFFLIYILISGIFKIRIILFQIIIFISSSYTFLLECQVSAFLFNTIVYNK